MYKVAKEAINIPLKVERPGISNRPPLENLAELYSCYTAKEIAEMFRVKESTVRSWIARARKKYKEFAAMEEKAQGKGV